MKNKIYSISDASKKVNVETHVLRYWEEELCLIIPRNDLGHRYYSEDDINTFLKIKKLKEKNYSLHEIKDIIKKDNAVSKSSSKNQLTIASGTGDAVLKNDENGKLDRFREIMNQIVSSAIENNNRQLAEAICETTSERVMKEMNYLFRTLDEDEETRFIQLEAAVSAALGAKKEIAASKNGKKRLFRKKNS